MWIINWRRPCLKWEPLCRTGIPVEGLKKGEYYIALVLPSLTPTGALDNAISVYQSLTSSFSQHSPSTLSALYKLSGHTLSDRQSLKYFALFLMSTFIFAQAANLLPVLRARICGYTGIFRIVESFWPRPRGHPHPHPGPLPPHSTPAPAPECPQSPGTPGSKKSEGGGFFSALFGS